MKIELHRWMDENIYKLRMDKNIKIDGSVK